MLRWIHYTLFFLALWLLQILFVDNLSLGVYVVPLIYVALIALLPTAINTGALLFIAFVAGAVVDISSGSAGLATIALLTTAFCRPLVVSMTIGREELKESVVPTSNRIGVGKFLRYSITLIAINSIVYFSFEVLTFNYLYLTLLRIVISTAITALLVYVIQLLYWRATE